MSVIQDLSIYLPLDSITVNDGTSDQTVDKSGNANDADVVGDVNLLEDATFGYVCNFPGSTDYLSYPVWDSGNFNGAFDPEEKTYAVTAWVRPSMLNGSNPIFAISSPANQGGETEILLSIDGSGRLFVEIDAITCAVPTQADVADLQADQWHFIALVMYQNQLTLRHNSAITQFTLDSNTGFNKPTNGQMSIGACLADGSSFNGSMANVRIYKSELTSTDLDEIVNADLANELQVSFPLDAIVEGKLLDVSGNGYDGTVGCTVSCLTVITDPDFGSVVSFSNDYPVDIALSNPHYQQLGEITSLTVQMWVRTTDTSEMQLLDYSDNYYQLSLGTNNSTDGLVCWATCDRTGVRDVLYSAHPVNDGEWHFISVVYEAGIGAKFIYIDGVLDSDSDYTAHLNQPLGYPINGTVYRGYIGRLQNTIEKMYGGDMSQASIFHRALSQESILQSMGTAAVATASFYSVFPLGFELVDDEEINTLFISDHVEENEVSLFLANISDQAIIFAETLGVSESNFQLQLVFRPGTLSQASVNEISLKNTDNWYMQVGATLPDGSVPLYLSAKIEMTVYPLENLPFTFLNLTADAAGGTRSSRVQLNYQQLTFQGQTTLVTGQREVTINIMNRQGKKDIPLIVGFSGTNQVVIDKSNNVSFRITNGLSSDTSYDQNESNAISLLANAERTTSFVLSFEGWDENAEGNSDDSSWDLNSYQQLAQITGVTFNSELSDVGEANNWQVVFFKEGEKPFWRISPTVDVSLNPRDSIVFDIEGIVPKEPASHSHMYIDYQNVPGYWDGQFMLLLEKGLLKQKGSFVGIGLEDDPQLPLSLGAPDTGLGYDSSNLKFYTNDKYNQRLTLSDDGAVTIGSNGKAGYVNLKGGSLNLQPITSNNYPSVYWTSSMGSSSIQYVARQGNESNGKLLIRTYPTPGDVAVTTTAMSIQDDGKVLVGDNGNSPQSQLTVDPGDVSLRRNNGNGGKLKFSDEGNNEEGTLASTSDGGSKEMTLTVGNVDGGNPKLVLNQADQKLTLKATDASLLVDASYDGEQANTHGKVEIRGNTNGNNASTAVAAQVDFQNLEGTSDGNRTIANIQVQRGTSGSNSGAFVFNVMNFGSLYKRMTLDDWGHLGLGKEPDSSAVLSVNGDIKGNSDVIYDGALKPTNRPFYVERFGSVEHGTDYDTGVSASEYTAVIAGFFASDGDIDEDDEHGTVIKVRMKAKNGRWYIQAKFATHNGHEDWSVDVLFMDINLAEDRRSY